MNLPSQIVNFWRQEACLMIISYSDGSNRSCSRATYSRKTRGGEKEAPLLKRWLLLVFLWLLFSSLVKNFFYLQTKYVGVCVSACVWLSGCEVFPSESPGDRRSWNGTWRPVAWEYVMRLCVATLRGISVLYHLPNVKLRYLAVSRAAGPVCALNFLNLVAHSRTVWWKWFVIFGESKWKHVLTTGPGICWYPRGDRELVKNILKQ